MSPPRRQAIAVDPATQVVMAEVVAVQIEQGLSLDSPLMYAQVALLAESVLGRPVEVSDEAIDQLERMSHL